MSSPSSGPAFLSLRMTPQRRRPSPAIDHPGQSSTRSRRPATASCASWGRGVTGRTWDSSCRNTPPPPPRRTRQTPSVSLPPGPPPSAPAWNWPSKAMSPWRRTLSSPISRSAARPPRDHPPGTIRPGTVRPGAVTSAAALPSPFDPLVDMACAQTIDRTRWPVLARIDPRGRSLEHALAEGDHAGFRPACWSDGPLMAANLCLVALDTSVSDGPASGRGGHEGG